MLQNMRTHLINLPLSKVEHGKPLEMFLSMSTNILFVTSIRPKWQGQVLEGKQVLFVLRSNLLVVIMGIEHPEIYV